MANSLKKYLRNNVYSLALVAIALVLLILTIQSAPGDNLYRLKKGWINLETMVAPIPLNKATVRFRAVQGLLQTFKQIQSKNPHDPRLIEIGKELVEEEQSGINYLDLAKRNQDKIQPQVKALCDVLESQQIAMTQAYSLAAEELKPQLHQILSQTDVYLSQALEW